MLQAIFSPGELAQMAANVQTANPIIERKSSTDTPFYRCVNTTPCYIFITDPQSQTIEILLPNARVRGKLGSHGEQSLMFIFDPTKQGQVAAFTQSGVWNVWVEFSSESFTDVG